MCVMDEDAIIRALAIDPEWQRAARASWLALMDLAVWGDLRSARLGAMARLRKRVLEVGERTKSVAGDRGWIPSARERVKSALASVLNLRQSLNELVLAAQALDTGADRDAFNMRLAELQRLVDALSPQEAKWAMLLDSQYRGDSE